MASSCAGLKFETARLFAPPFSCSVRVEVRVRVRARVRAMARVRVRARVRCCPPL